MNSTNKFVFLKLMTILDNMNGERHKQRQTRKNQQDEKTWVEISHLFEGNIVHSWIIWNVRDSEYQDGLKYLWSPPTCIKDDQTKIARSSIMGMIRHGLRELGNYSWKQKFRIVCNKKSWFSFKFCSTKFLFVAAFNLICSSRCGVVGKF
jgi:hypothetical protein